jgi:phosphoribosylglycinamide formyltransferase-1
LRKHLNDKLQNRAQNPTFCALTHTYMPTNIAIFASGSGSNAENIIRYFSNNEAVNVVLVVSNKADAYVLQRAERLGVPSVVLTGADMRDEARVMALMAEYKVDFIVLAGYLLRVPSYLVDAYPRAMLNIHPALLPEFGGKGMYGERVHQAVIAAGRTRSGITIHYVNENYDEGAHVFQAVCMVDPHDTPDTLAAKVHALEYEHFPRVIGEVISAR